MLHGEMEAHKMYLKELLTFLLMSQKQKIEYITLNQI